MVKLLEGASAIPSTILLGKPGTSHQLLRSCSRLIEILIDEIGHVSFQRLSMGSAGLALTKALLPIVARGLSRSIPEVRALGALPHAPVEGITALDLHGLPDTVRRNAFFA